jgi:VIT1/CCC1 family predicted Fe2+/Mn2+ transporter
MRIDLWDRITGPAKLQKIRYTAFLIDFVTIFPVVLPFIIFQDADRAVFFSHTVAVILFFLIGYYWALHLNWNKFKTGIILAIIGATVIAVSYYLGW